MTAFGGPGAPGAGSEPDVPDWTAAHQGIDPAGVPLLAPWLRGVDALAAPLVTARVPPDALTALGLLTSLAVPVLVGRGRPGAGVPVVAVSVVLDALDGTVARGAGRVSSYGRALDSGCDRVSELAWWWALAAAGVPRGRLVGTAVLTLGMEGWRAWRGRFGRLTVWERPTRTVLVVVGLATAALAEAGRVPADYAGFTAGEVTGTVGAVLAVAGAAQLARGRRPHPT